MTFVYDKVTVKKRRRLPHWDAERGLYFITLRQIDALPLHDYLELAAQKRAAIADANQLKDVTDRAKALEAAEHRFRLEIENLLDEGLGSCVLAQSEAADAAHAKLLSLDETILSHVAHAIMPNHIHVVFQLQQLNLADTMQRIKGGVSFDVNHSIGRSGPLWQDEYYDTLIRDQQHLQNAVKYTLDNPAKAGLSEWPWVHLSEQRVREILGLAANAE